MFHTLLVVMRILYCAAPDAILDARAGNATEDSEVVWKSAGVLHAGRLSLDESLYEYDTVLGSRARFTHELFTLLRE
jgi:hypothetical protein